MDITSMADSGIGNQCNCQLWLRICEIKVANEYNTPPADGLENWRPPEHKEAFEALRETQWRRWTHGHLTRFEALPPATAMCDTTSMFWCPRRHAFLQAPFDCTRQDLAQTEDNGVLLRWDSLTFEQPAPREVECRGYPNLWRIGYRLRETQIPGPMSKSWEDLLGATYFREQSSNHRSIDTSPICEFAGSLPVLLALVTFAVHWCNLEKMLVNDFQPTHGDTLYRPSWEFSPPGDETRLRGIVVEVAYHPDHNEDMQAWELGKKGPILTCDDSVFA